MTPCIRNNYNFSVISVGGARGKINIKYWFSPTELLLLYLELNQIVAKQTMLLMGNFAHRLRPDNDIVAEAF